MLPRSELVLEFDARGDSSLAEGPLFNIPGEGELDVVDDEDDVEDDAAAITVAEEFDVDFVELEGDADEGEVDIERFGPPILIVL